MEIHHSLEITAPLTFLLRKYEIHLLNYISKAGTVWFDGASLTG